MFRATRNLRARASLALDSARARTFPGDESGVMLIEVIISAALLAMIAGFVFTTLTSSSRAGVEERRKAQAFAIAQDDQARLRSLGPIPLSRLSETRSVTEAGTTFTVVSKGTPGIDRSSSTSCDSGNTSADYIAISSKVSWTGMRSPNPATIESIVSPYPGTLAADRGALAVSVVNSRPPASPNLTVSGSGASTFSGTTDSNGCVIFGDLPAGNYNVTPAVSGTVVDPNGNPPATKATTVVGQAANSLSFQYDRPGGLRVGFRTIKNGTPGAANVVASTGNSFRVNNSGMSASKGFTNGTFVRSFASTTTLFPFVSPYSVWAGSCDANNPGSTAYGISSATVHSPYGEAVVPVNGAPTTTINVDLTLPALNLTVYRGSRNDASPWGGLASNTTTVRIRDRDCSVGGTPVTRNLTLSGTTGKLADPALPWSDYHVCVRGASNASTASPNPPSNVRWVNINDVEVENPLDPTDLTVYLRDGQTGSCPA